MSCYHPIDAFRTPDGISFSELRRNDNLGSIQIPCGQCIGCRLRRARDWSLRIMHEASLYEANSFVTLTYGRDKVPANGSLDYLDFQMFMRRLRKHLRPERVRFFMCGEYGPLNLRPHYHACLFNVDFRSDRVLAGKSGAGAVYFDSPTLRDLWGHGMVSVQDLTLSAAAYCARYIVDKVTGDAAEAHYESVDADGVVTRRVPEFSRCSLKPGIGARWFQRFGSDVFPMDAVVSKGEKYTVPKYYDKLRRRGRDAGFDDEIDYARYKRGRLTLPDSTPERLAVREVVHKARVRHQKREFGE